jgi:hypothetical protein
MDTTSAMPDVAAQQTAPAPAPAVPAQARGPELAARAAEVVTDVGTRLGAELGADLGKELRESALLLAIALVVLGLFAALASTALLLG